MIVKAQFGSNPDEIHRTPNSERTRLAANLPKKLRKIKIGSQAKPLVLHLGLFHPERHSAGVWLCGCIMIRISTSHFLPGISLVFLFTNLRSHDWCNCPHVISGLIHSVASLGNLDIDQTSRRVFAPGGCVGSIHVLS
jgi:hypothetical protein